MRLTEQELLEIAGLRQQNMSIRKISEVTGIPKSTIGDALTGTSAYAKEFYDKLEKDIVGGYETNAHDNRQRLGAGRYIITSAQNNTKLHNAAWETLQVIAAYYDAEIIVATFTYNINGFQNLTKASDDLWYDPRIRPHIINEPVELADDLLFCGELNILPTTLHPFSGLQNYVTHHSGIIPHAQLALESLPRHKHDLPRFLYTTGAITLPNYIQKKSGQKAEFYHAIGALFVEVDENGDWWCRQLHAEKETGNIQDLTTHFTPTGYTEGVAIEALNLGDLHLEKSDNDVLGKSTGLTVNTDTMTLGCRQDDNLITQLRPKHVFCHDTADFTARNHHNINEAYFRFIKHHFGCDSVKQEMQLIADFLAALAENNPETKVVVVESNHDNALSKWLQTADYRTDPANAEFFLRLQSANYTHMAKYGQPFHAFEYACNSLNKQCQRVKFLKTDESYRLFGKNGIECGQHGDHGINGVRGSNTAFTKLGIRYNVGHSHAACLKLGVAAAGVTGALDMGYNVGGSTWSNSHIITYPNSKRAIITYRGGRFF